MVSTRPLAFSIAAFGAVIAFTDAEASKIRGADSYAFAFAEPGKADQRVKADRGPELRGEALRLSGAERDIVREYYSPDCPPGLEKKNNGCLPPGETKYRFQIGSKLPAGHGGGEAPSDLYRRLPLLPEGFEYRFLDGSLAIVERSTLIVLDAIRLY